MSASQQLVKTASDCLIATLLLTALGAVGLYKSTTPSVNVQVLGAMKQTVQATIYGADYCTPCRSYIARVLQEMPRDGWVCKYSNDVDKETAHIVIDKTGDDFEQLGIERIPCTIIRKHGKEVRRIFGALSPDDLAASYNEVGRE